jgi:hypothetical protein
MARRTIARLVRSEGRRTEGVVTVTRYGPDRDFGAVAEFRPIPPDE